MLADSGVVGGLHSFLTNLCSKHDLQRSGQRLSPWLEPAGERVLATSTWPEQNDLR